MMKSTRSIIAMVAILGIAAISGVSMKHLLILAAFFVVIVAFNFMPKILKNRRDSTPQNTREKPQVEPRDELCEDEVQIKPKESVSKIKARQIQAKSEQESKKQDSRRANLERLVRKK